MSRRHVSMLAGSLAICLAGCAADLSSLWPGFGKPSSEVWYEANPTSISYVSGPATAVAGQPVELQARVIIGSSSCDRFKDLSASLDEAARTVTLSGMRESKRSKGPVECTSDYGAKLATVSVTFPAAGTYRVVAERFEGAVFHPDETPRATIGIQVEAP